MVQLILASSSTHRRQQLQRLGIEFRSRTAHVDESLRAAEKPKERALRLAIAKAESVKSQNPQAIIIGADQVCACDNQIFRKPKNRKNNIQQLIAFSG
ncbi:MAG: septum formation inhibitor Maf, partial [Proteobacteria bacterium]